MMKSDYSYDYQAFVFDTRKNEYVPEGRPVEGKILCKARLEEKINKGWLPDYLDSSKTVIKKRKVTITYGEWEKVE